MAIDTENTRASTIGSGLDFLTVLPAPDATIDDLDRPQTAGLYAMASAEPAVAEGFPPVWQFSLRITRVRSGRGGYPAGGGRL